jgi:hypothetical protein
LQMGDAACEAVFAQGQRLNIHVHPDSEEMSSGDGAWIMQKCAKALGGACTIKFDEDGTVFCFRCPAEPYSSNWAATHENFELPPGSWGIAVDDSKIQRRLSMRRIFKYAGIDDSMGIILGKDPSDVEDMDKLFRGILEKDPDCKILVLMDENLEYSTDTFHTTLSGSKCLQNALKKLPHELESRILALVRSSNDSRDDIATYTARTHGFFPKSSVRKQQVQEILAPLWKARFAEVTETTTDASLNSKHDNISVASDDDSVATHADLLTKEELLDYVRNIVAMLEKKDPDVAWPSLWSALHTLKGDLMVLGVMGDIGGFAVAVDLICQMRGAKRPTNFESLWKETCELVEAGVRDL